jgi:hypothetical protein
MDSQSEVQSSHNSSETTNATVSSWDDLTEGQQWCLQWAHEQDWDRIKVYAKEHGPEVLLGVYSVLVDEQWRVISVLYDASRHQNVEMVKLTLEAGFDNKEAMYTAAEISMKNSDNSTILRLLLEHGLDKRIIISHGLDPDMDLHFEGWVENFSSNLLVLAAEKEHIDQAIALLDHG